MITKIYVDMDGVLCNFDSRYRKLFDEEPGASRDKKEFNSNWDKFITGKNFETLDVFPGAFQLLNFLDSLKDVRIEILSSSGGEKHHAEVEKQKRRWLVKRGISYKPNIVPGRKHKAKYADKNTILIDDTEDVIDAFNAAGGHGILHTDAQKTIQVIKSLI